MELSLPNCKGPTWVNYIDPLNSILVTKNFLSSYTKKCQKLFILILQRQLFAKLVMPPLDFKTIYLEFQNANDMSVNLSLKSKKRTNG